MNDYDKVNYICERRNYLLRQLERIEEQNSSAKRRIFWISLALSILIVIFLSTFAHASECLSSAKEVRAVHGMSAHSYWGYHVEGYEGRRCWSNVSIAKEVMRNAKSARPYHHDTKVRKEVMPEKRPLETASEVMQTHTSESALSAAVTHTEVVVNIDRVIDLLLEHSCVDTEVMAWNKLVDIAHDRWINEVCSTTKLQDRCPYQGRQVPAR